MIVFLKVPVLKKLILIFIISFFSSSVNAQKIIPLTKWSFKEAENTSFLMASVPGNVQRDLLKNGLIPNPFLALNEKKIAWVEEKEWVYKHEFNIEVQDVESEDVLLNFEGLDTYADVYLNEQLILSADNMFRHWRISVKHYLVPGNNVLRIHFLSTARKGRSIAALSSIKYPADNEKGAVKISPFIRKAPFQFGWDFAPRILTTGIWKLVYLEIINQANIENVAVSTKLLSASKAIIRSTVFIDVKKAGAYTLRVQGNGVADKLFEKRVLFEKGVHKVSADISVNNPEVWWPNGAGKQHLYSLNYELIFENHVISTNKLKVGIRDIKVINEPDSIGENFYFKVNDRPIYIKGANYVPVNAMPDEKIDSLRLRQLFLDMKKSHFNMVRVWGGGIYESDYFYDLADEYGILVWQDFPFACTMYPSDDQFLKSIAEEARDNIKRLRNRTSLAIWCGNNEIDVGWKNWGWQKTYGYSSQDSLELEQGYAKLFKNLLPSILTELDPDRFYFHSSPISNWGKKEDFRKGDNHYWGVYHGEQPFSAYAEFIPRFNSEFGFQSFPSWNTLKEIAGPEPELSDSILVERQKSYKGNALLTKYMNWYYQVPKEARTYVYQSQLQQAEGMRLAILASRASQPFNMGVLMWQLNDVWPAISWSAIEFNGQWKAAQYFIRDAYKPTALYVRKADDNIEIQIVSDKGIGFKSKVRVVKYDLSGKIKGMAERFVNINQGGNKYVFNDFLKNVDSKKEFIHSSIIADNKILAEDFFYVVPVKDLDLPAVEFKWKLRSNKEGYFIDIISKVLLKNLYVTIDGDSKIYFSDNFFDVLPGKSYRISFKSDKSMDVLRKKIKFQMVQNQL